MIEIRRTKAEGGWGVVCTEQTEIHPSTDMAPYVELRNWDDRDLPVLSAMSAAVHEHGALAALELSHSGINTSNLGSREPALGPSTMQTLQAIAAIPEPFHAKAMDKQDIHDFRRYHKEAAQRGCAADFDIIYVFASQFLALPNQFISKKYNRRTDEYGGSLLNRIRLLRELVEDTLEATRGKHAVAVRLTVDDLLSTDDEDHPELHEAFSLMGELPDLWDLTVSGWEADLSGTTRFDFDQSNIKKIAQVRGLTTKPIVSVRFFPTPQDMVRIVRAGYLDLVGSARQSIADPFLPNKLRENKPDQVRPCIKCNICIAGDLSAVGVQCTQNPSFGEEWRRGWHPEEVPPHQSESKILVVGGGPAGLECTRALGQRGYKVLLCEARAELGGRVVRESRLPMIEVWRAVADYRIAAIERMDNVEVRLNNSLSSSDILELGADHVVVATGSTWRRDCADRRGSANPEKLDGVKIYTPDDILDGAVPDGKVVIYDDDHYVMGGLLAEHLIAAGCRVQFVTPAAEVSVWTHRIMEQRYIQKRLLQLGVEITPHSYLSGAGSGKVELSCYFTGSLSDVGCDSLVLVTSRLQNDLLYRTLQDAPDELAKAGVSLVRAIGDALVPGLIAQSIRSGHKFARELDCKPDRLVVRRSVAVPENAS